uniref:EAL domain-containing protein n=1 Tax=uncultured Roseobacter sp. TaxID=114847 RepID=UPI002615075B
TALIAGKSMGRNQTVLFQEDMRGLAVKTARIAAQIKVGLSEEAFEPFYQPQIATPGTRLIGLEALARWKQPDGTYAPASSFIDVANETGLITEIDHVILRQSLDVLGVLARQGILDPRVSVNLSSVQLRNEAIVERLLDECLVRNVLASQVTIEVLESTLLDERADTIGQNINALSKAGFRIELDDFGTGHTALASLTRFPVHQIKVDRSLVEGIDNDQNKRAIAGGLYLVCKRLGIEAIAEGVETEAELAALNDIGFTNFQGYYFARPMSEQQLVGWITSRDMVAYSSGKVSSYRSLAK